MKRNCEKQGGEDPSTVKVCNTAKVCNEERQASHGRRHSQESCHEGEVRRIDWQDILAGSSKAGQSVAAIQLANENQWLPWHRWFSPKALTDAFRRSCQECRMSVFAFCCLFIALVGILDTWLVIKYADSIFEMEQNPICLYLIQQDPHHLMVFVYGKAAGIFTVLCVLLALFVYWKKVAMQVTFAVTFFQFSLLSYLYVLSDFPHYYRVFID